jgi:hypothetical protein
MSDNTLKEEVKQLPFEMQWGISVKLYYDATTHDADMQIAPGEVVKVKQLVRAYRELQEIKRILRIQE